MNFFPVLFLVPLSLLQVFFLSTNCHRWAASAFPPRNSKTFARHVLSKCNSFPPERGTCPEEGEEPRAEGSLPGPAAACTWSGISVPHLQDTQQNPPSQHLPFLQRQKRCPERHACNSNSENFKKTNSAPKTAMP